MRCDTSARTAASSPTNPRKMYCPIRSRSGMPVRLSIAVHSFSPAIDGWLLTIRIRLPRSQSSCQLQSRRSATRPASVQSPGFRSASIGMPGRLCDSYNQRGGNDSSFARRYVVGIAPTHPSVSTRGSDKATYPISRHPHPKASILAFDTSPITAIFLARPDKTMRPAIHETTSIPPTVANVGAANPHTTRVISSLSRACQIQSPSPNAITPTTTSATPNRRAGRSIARRHRWLSSKKVPHAAAAPPPNIRIRSYT